MRYAVYFAPPPGSPFHQIGSRWLGRDAFTGELLDQPPVVELAGLTEEPRRYGFHATLKPPFALLDTVAPESLLRAVAALAASEECFHVRLKVALLDRFLALVPCDPSKALHRIADRAVRELDGFRRLQSEQELARRRAADLSPRQEQHLQGWGYPYIFEDFRFHMTLTGTISEAAAERIAAVAAEHFAPVLNAPVLIDGVTLFQEAAPGAPFLATRHFPFARSAAEVAA